MVKGIGRRYKTYDQQKNWLYNSPNSAFVIPNQSNITNERQQNNVLGSPVYQSIITIDNTQGKKL